MNGAAGETDVAGCELERERSVSRRCDSLGTSLARCPGFSRRSTSLTTQQQADHRVLNSITWSQVLCFECQQRKIHTL